MAMVRQPRESFPTPSLIADSAALAALCERLRREAFVTADTEFMRERTYWPELCVVQLAGEAEVAVVDAQAPGMDLAPLGALLADPAVTKVFHAARQDIEIFVQLFGATPTPLFDTQIAAMVAGFGDQVGYEFAGGRADRRADRQGAPLQRLEPSAAVRGTGGLCRRRRDLAAPGL